MESNAGWNEEWRFLYKRVSYSLWFMSCILFSWSESGPGKECRWVEDEQVSVLSFLRTGANSWSWYRFNDYRGIGGFVSLAPIFWAKRPRFRWFREGVAHPTVLLRHTAANTIVSSLIEGWHRAILVTHTTSKWSVHLSLLSLTVSIDGAVCAVRWNGWVESHAENLHPSSNDPSFLPNPRGMWARIAQG